MDKLQRFDIKVFADDGADIAATDFVPVFQRWIQEHSVEGTLIDVADYSHIHHGPGIVLVGYEANIGIDYAGGRMGLLYHLRRPVEGAFESGVRDALKQALTACSQLEQEPEFNGRLRFRGENILFIANDRLVVPNDEASQSQLHGALAEILGTIYDCDLVLEPKAEDGRERIGFEITAPEKMDTGSLAVRCAAPAVS